MVSENRTQSLLEHACSQYSCTSMYKLSNSANFTLKLLSVVILIFTTIYEENVVRINSRISFHLRKLSDAKFSLLCYISGQRLKGENLL